MLTVEPVKLSESVDNFAAVIDEFWLLKVLLVI